MRKPTKKQREILKILTEAVRDENGVWVRWLNIRELRDRVSYKTSRDALYFSIRTLVRYGLIERLPQVMVDTPDGRRWHTPLAPTSLALDHYAKIMRADKKILYTRPAELDDSDPSTIICEGFDDVDPT